MKRTISNAFTNGGSRKRSRRSLASLLASMQAALAETDFGWSLMLRPIRPIDLVPVWTRMASGGIAETLIIDLDGAALPTRGSNIRTASGGKPEISSMHGRDAIVVGDLALSELAPHLDSRKLLLVRVDGPVEPSDVDAIRAAARRGRSALEAEVRAVAAAVITGSRVASIETRSRRPALALVAENFRHYLAALCNRPMGLYEPPEIPQLDRIFSVSGCLTVRPVETDVLPTSIDIGISTSGDEQPGPATQSLIYDLPSRTWHDD